MFSIDLESDILALARAKGLLPSVQPDELDPARVFDPSQVQASTMWGPRLDSLIAEGLLPLETVNALAWESIQANPPKDFLEAYSLRDLTGGYPSEEAPLPAIGSRFQDLSLLGEGATARVYKAFDGLLQRWVALKYLKGTTSGHQGSILAEARAQAQVEHPNICRIYEVGDDGGHPFIAMQLVEGPTLAAAFVGMDLETKLQVVRDVAEGIHRAHRKGLVHLDLKAGNILMETLEEGGWRPFLTDFGMVRSVEATTIQICPMGTPPYSSPEQLAGVVSQVDRRSDIYSMGVLLYVLFTHAFPFEADTFQDLLRAIQEHKVIPLRRRKPDLPEDLDVLVAKCMAKDPTLRYDSAQALADDIQRFLDGEPLAARQYTLRHQAWVWLKRNRLRILAVAAGGGVCLAAMVFWRSVQTTSRQTAETIAKAQESQRQKDQEVQGLLNELHRKEEQFGLIMEGYTARIQKAKNAAEAAALTREAEARKADLEKELTALRSRVQVSTGRPVALPQTIPQAAVPKPQEAPKPPIASPSPSAAEKPSQEPEFKESQKTDITKLDEGELTKFKQAQTQTAPVVSPGTSGPSPTNLAQSPSNPRIRKMVVPNIPPDLLAKHDGKRVTVKLLLDVFGNPQRVILDDCPPDLQGYIREAASRTLFAPTMLNGRPVKGSIELDYRISTAGVSTK